jgi:ATP-dependent Clp protease adapter protein ClpS
MSGNDTRFATKDAVKVERPRLHKVILINDDYTPREFVVTVLKAEFRISEDQAMRVMITAQTFATASCPPRSCKAQVEMIAAGCCDRACGHA